MAGITRDILGREVLLWLMAGSSKWSWEAEGPGGEGGGRHASRLPALKTDCYNTQGDGDGAGGGGMHSPFGRRQRKMCLPVGQLHPGTPAVTGLGGGTAAVGPRDP